MIKFLLPLICLTGSLSSMENNAKLIMDGDGQTYLIYEGSTYQILEMVQIKPPTSPQN